MFYHKLSSVVIIILYLTSEVDSRNLFSPHRRIKQSRYPAPRPLRFGNKALLRKPWLRASKYRMRKDKRNIFSDLDISFEEGFVPIKYETAQGSRKKVFIKEKEPKKEILFLPSLEFLEKILAQPVLGWKDSKAKIQNDSQLLDYHPTETTISYVDLAVVNRNDPIQSETRKQDHYAPFMEWESQRL